MHLCKNKYCRVSCTSVVLFYIFLRSRNPSVAITLDVKSCVPIRCYQQAELLLCTGEVRGSGPGQLLQHRDLCSERRELSGRRLRTSRRKRQQPPRTARLTPFVKGWCEILQAETIYKQSCFLSLKSCLIRYFGKKISELRGSVGPGRVVV